MFGLRPKDEGPLPFTRHRPTTNPILPVTDVERARTFYEALGFTVVAYDEHYAWVKHCGWEWFHLRRVDSLRANETSAYLHVADADAWRKALIGNWTTAAAIGLGQQESFITEASDMPWGKHEFSVTDPDGNVVRIGSPLSD